MQEVFIVEDGKSSVRAEITQQDRMFSIALDGKKYLVDAVEVEKNVYSLILEGKSFEVIIERLFLSETSTIERFTFKAKSSPKFPKLKYCIASIRKPQIPR